MGILDKLLNKKRARRNNWPNVPYHIPQPNYQYALFNETQPDYRYQNMEEQYYQNYSSETPQATDWDYQHNSLTQPREPFTQPFYGNPLSVDSNYYDSAFNGQSQNAIYPSVNQQYANSYQPQQGWGQQGYFPNGQTQQVIQPNPFQANPYFQQPIQPNPMLNKQSSGFSNVLNQFKSQNGSIDFNKMMGTAGQMVSAVNQFSGIIKGIGGIFKV